MSCSSAPSCINWTCLTNYQHPPFLFLLWYLILGFEKVRDIVDSLLSGEGGGGGDEGGGEEEAPAEEEEG